MNKSRALQQPTQQKSPAKNARITRLCWHHISFSNNRCAPSRPRAPLPASAAVGALLVNRPAGRFILRSGSAGSKGCAPACHNVSHAADSLCPFSATGVYPDEVGAPLPQSFPSVSDFPPPFLRALCVNLLI